MEPLRVASVGLGPIGARAAGIVLERRGLSLVGAADLDPDKAGRDVGALLEPGREVGVRVEPDLPTLLAKVRPDVVVHATSSFVDVVEAEILAIVGHGAHVVTSCEEMLLCDHAHPEAARRIDAAARRHGVSVLGTGVNPGFVLDLLPVLLSGAARRVDRVRASRVVDAGTRRLPLQRKVGAGMEEGAFRTLAAAGRIGHVGMPESVALVGRGLGLGLDRVEHAVEPVLATRDVEAAVGPVRAGRVAGIHDVGRGWRGGDLLVELDLTMAVGETDPRDEIHLEGEPPLHLVIRGGVPGDVATAAILVNAVALVCAAAPGLHTVLDLPPPRATP